jgi:hypothetical protein
MFFTLKRITSSVPVKEFWRFHKSKSNLNKTQQQTCCHWDITRYGFRMRTTMSNVKVFISLVNKRHHLIFIFKVASSMTLTKILSVACQYLNLTVFDFCLSPFEKWRRKWKRLQPNRAHLGQLSLGHEYSRQSDSYYLIIEKKNPVYKISTRIAQTESINLLLVYPPIFIDYVFSSEWTEEMFSETHKTLRMPTFSECKKKRKPIAR